MPETTEHGQPGQEEPRRIATQADIEAEYAKLAQESAAREVKLSADNLPVATPEGARTLGEAMNMAEDQTDLQFAMGKLFPIKIGYESAMVARIDPNVYIPMLHIMSVDEIMMSDPMKPIDVDLIWMRNNTILSIGLDGMGRIDTAELLGAAREEKKAERMLSGRLGV